jgi:hypothetical protein
VHDAVLIESPLEHLEETGKQTQQVLSEASALVFGAFRLRSGVEMYRYPERYMDERGAKMWERVQEILSEL